MQRKFRNFILVLSLLGFFGLYGCVAAVVGVGAAGAAGAAGTFSYFSGKLTKTYESEYNKTVRASSDILERLKIPITETIADGLKTDIRARRPDGTPVAIEVVRIDQDHTQVSVRTGSFGLWDKRVSQQIQDDINQNLVGSGHASENSAQNDTPPPIGGMIQPKIKEQDLGESSAQETVDTESTLGVGGLTHAEQPSKFAQMNADSIFIIFFEQNSNDLSKNAIEKLDQLFEILLKNPGSEILLNGYSDSSGSTAYNEKISEIRANAVKSYLVRKGIEPTRITAFGYGARKFLASNKSKEGRQFNRRVEIEIITPPKNF